MIRRLMLAMVLFTLCLFAVPQVASAFNPFSGACSSGGGDSAVCQTSGGTNPVTDELAKITNIVAFVGGAAAIIIIIVSAIKFITSGSDVSTGSRTDLDVENARRGIANALIGLAVIVLARTLILFVLKKI